MYKFYKHIWERKENILKKSFLTNFLAKPFLSVQNVQVKNRLIRFIFFLNFFVYVQGVQAHLGEIGKHSKEIFFINVQVVQAHLGEIEKYSEENSFNYFPGKTLL